MNAVSARPRRILVTGASRGIGHAVASHLLDRGDHVFLAARHAGVESLCGLVNRHGGRAVTIELLLEDEASARKAAEHVASTTAEVDAIVHCAGVNVAPSFARVASKGGLDDLEIAAIEEMFQINVTGTLAVLQAFAPLLDASPSPKIMTLCTSRGSLTLTQDGRSMGYAITKAALAMLTRKVSFDAQDRSWLAVAVDPGWVRTDMGGADAPTGPMEAADDLVTLLDSLDASINGQFVDRMGNALPW